MKEIKYNSNHEKMLKKQVKSCVDNLNYEKIAKAMKALNWYYWGMKQEDMTPAYLKSQIKENSKRWMQSFLEQNVKEMTTGTGGFKLKMKYWKKDDSFTTDLLFYVTDWDEGYY